jgi:hypothetical protein
MRVRFVFHLAAVILYAGLALAFTWPLALHLHDGTLGAGIGDNATFVWNFWWIRTAIANGVSPFWTSSLFAPLGMSLLLHTTTLLPTVTATMMLPQADALTTHNVALIGTVFLNGLCAYGAAYALTRHAGASLSNFDRHAAAFIAGLTFAASPCLMARLQGHFNVLSAWGLPLLVMALARFSRSAGAVGAAAAAAETAAAEAADAGGATIANAALVAAALVALAYTDYYFFIFGLLLAALLLLRVEVVSTPLPAPPGDDVRAATAGDAVEQRGPADGSRGDARVMTLPAPRDSRGGASARVLALRVLAIIAIALIVAIAVIELSGGGELTIAGIHISARSTFNLRTALSIVGLLALAVWKAPRVRAAAPPWRPILTAAALLGIALSPLIVAAARLIASGDYATQTYLWRSAPPGIDIGALILGNPFHPLTGSLTRAAYASLGIDAVESAVWLGLIPMACIAYACFAPAARTQRSEQTQRTQRTQPEMRRWLLITAVFFVWALGPYLMVFGANSGVMLPQTLLRFIPLLANARVPGRAFVMVALGASLIVAFVLTSALTVSRMRKPALAGLAAALILLDLWPAPQPFVPFDRPALYATLRAQPAGPVLDLPIGIRDGFGERGHLDHRALFYQTLHEHPIAGGFVARLSPRVRQAYEQDPVLGALLLEKPMKPSAGQTLACAFRYVIVPKAIAASTRDIVNQVFELERLDGDDARDLYRVTNCRMKP